MIELTANIERKTLNVQIERNDLSISFSHAILLNSNAKNITKLLQCGEIIGSGKVVYLSSNKIYIASNDNPNCIGRVIGMTQQAGLEDEFVNVVLSGELNGLSLITNDQYYLGLNGSLTKVIPLTGLVYPMGEGVTDSRFNVKIGNYLIRG